MLGRFTAAILFLSLFRFVDLVYRIATGPTQSPSPRLQIGVGPAGMDLYTW